jgi:hypothetical protein
VHSLDVPPRVMKHKTQTFFRLSYVWRLAQVQGTYYISGGNDGSLVPDNIILQTGWDENLTMESVRDENVRLESANKPSVAKSAPGPDTEEESSEEKELHNNNIY